MFCIAVFVVDWNVPCMCVVESLHYYTETGTMIKIISRTTLLRYVDAAVRKK